jgi:hypothetical protein
MRLEYQLPLQLMFQLSGHQLFLDVFMVTRVVNESWPLTINSLN